MTVQTNEALRGETERIVNKKEKTPRNGKHNAGKGRAKGAVPWAEKQRWAPSNRAVRRDETNAKGGPVADPIFGPTRAAKAAKRGRRP